MFDFSKFCFEKIDFCGRIHEFIEKWLTFNYVCPMNYLYFVLEAIHFNISRIQALWTRSLAILIFWHKLLKKDHSSLFDMNLGRYNQKEILIFP